MRQLTYNLSLLAALILIAVGACAKWGWPDACLIVGTTIIGLTFSGLLLTRRKG